MSALSLGAMLASIAKYAGIYFAGLAVGAVASIAVVGPILGVAMLVATLRDRARQCRVVSREEAERLIAEAVARNAALDRRAARWSK